MGRISLKTKIATVVMLIMFTCVPLAAHLILSSLGDEFGRAVEAQQTTLVTRIAKELDDKLLVSQKALVSAARSVTPDHLTPGMARELLVTLPALASLFDNGVFIYTAEGKLLAGTIGEVARPGMDFSDREYVRATVAAGKPHISSPYISRQPHRHPVIMFTAPIFSRDGRLVALMGGSMDLLKENFLGSLAGAKVGRTGYFYLFTADETIMTHPHRGSILDRGLPPGVRDLYARGAADSGVVAGETVNANGEAVITTVKRLGTVPWMLAADYPVAEAYGPVSAVRRSVWLWILPGGILVASAVWLFMRQLTMPMLSLTEQIKGIEETGTYRNVLISSGDEIQTVADAFNSLMNQLHDKEEKLVHLSTRDAMTGLYNRRFFEAEIERLDRGRRFPVSVIMVDVDSLKMVNDTLGHEAGDRLILMASRALRGAFRAEDVMARIGGDEFAVILEGADETAAAESLTRIREGVAACNEEVGEFRLSLSLGAAMAAGPGALGAAWRRADRRMYEDKALHKSGLESR